MKKGVSLLLPLIIFFFAATPKIYAHPGRTAGDGCHFCRTNCASWGEIEDARHCHGGGTTTPVTKTAAPVSTPTPTKAPTPIPTVAPTLQPTPIPTVKPTTTPSSTPEPTEVQTSTPQVLGTSNEYGSTENSDPIGSLMGLVGMGVVSYGGYKVVKKARR